MGSYTTTKAALEQLILGKRNNLFSRYDKASALAYWYAFIAICRCLGERLPGSHEIKLSYETDLIDACLASDFGISGRVDERLLNGECGLFDLPEVQDWPLCGLWDLEQLHDHILPLAGTVSTFIPFSENPTSKLLWNSTKPAFSGN